GSIEASWLTIGNCELGLASFNANAELQQQATFEIDEHFCKGDWGLSYYDQVPMHPSPSDNWYFVMPLDYQSHPVSHIELFRYDFSGADPARTVEILHDDATPHADVGRMAFDADGALINSWTDGVAGYNVHARVYNADGSPRSSLLVLATAEGVGDVRPIVLSPGRAIVAWSYNEWTGRELLLDGNVTTTTSTTTTTLDDSAQPPELAVTRTFNLGTRFNLFVDAAHVVTDGHGVWVVAWSDGGPFTGLPSRVFVDSSHDNGRNWSGAHLVGAGSSAAVASDGHGGWLLTATQCRSEYDCSWTFWRSHDQARTWSTSFDP